jgi:hypothetical protein
MTDAAYESRPRFRLAEVSRIVPGLYGWLATVATPCLQRGASTAARTFAGLALVALLGALAFPQRRFARVLGVYGFLACCFGAWAGLGARLRSDQLDAVRGALGAVGFLLHALAWGAAPKEADAPATDNLVPGNPLQPRHKPPRLGVIVLGLGIGVALLPTGAAFAVEQPAASLLAHALAVSCGLLVVAASADISLRVGKSHRSSSWRSRATRSLWPLGGVIAAAGLGLIWAVLR